MPPSEPNEFLESNFTELKETINRLQSPIQDLPSLLGLLSAPLHCLGLLPPQCSTYHVLPLTVNGSIVLRHIPLLQRALLEHVIPSWQPTLVENQVYGVVEQYFCPDSFSFASPAAGELALHAYSAVLSSPLTYHSVHFLTLLSRAYPIDVLHKVVFSRSARTVGNRHNIGWEDCVRNVISVPAKVANALSFQNTSPPAELENGAYFNNVSMRCERLICSLSEEHSWDAVPSIVYLVIKLANVGVFPPSKPTSPAQPSFFQANYAVIRRHMSSPGYSATWEKIITNLPSTFSLNAILTSFLAHLPPVPDLDTSERTRSAVKGQALLFKTVFGELVHNSSTGELWDAVRVVILGREWTVGRARVVSCWIAGGGRAPNTQALRLMLKYITTLWATPDHIKHSLLKHHQYLTALLLLVLSYVTSSNMPDTVDALAHSPSLITGISIYIGHLDPAVRRCGMLVAEEVARSAEKKLDFGDWEGGEDGKHWCSALRQLMGGLDSTAEVTFDSDDDDDSERADDPTHGTSHTEKNHKLEQTRNPAIARGYDSDDSATGYASSPASSRSPSPSPSELQEIERDPTLRVGHKKIPRPVYLAQLAEMIRPTSGLKSDNEEGEATRIEVALNAAEELIRRKRDFGTELEENAVNLVYGLVGLQDNYELEGFAHKRQTALTAAIACCPRRAAPAIIEEFFKNQYSADQRFVILNALALGARELSSLSMPSATASQPLSFPSKRLPAALHAKYARNQEATLRPVQNLLEGFSQAAIDRTKDDAAARIPELVRERQLRVSRPARVIELSQPRDATRAQLAAHTMPKPTVSFTEVAAEHFICPLINRFWVFLRDEQARESRTAQQSKLHRYRATGTGLILSSLVLAHFLATLAVLVHAARNAREWLAIVAPNALELALALGTMRLSLQHEDNEDDESLEGGTEGKEAAILTTSLELILVILDGCVEVDRGRSISLEHTAMVVGAGEWASEILSRLENGVKVIGGGGTQEVKLRRAAAGVILKVDEVVSPWKRSMVDVM